MSLKKSFFEFLLVGRRVPCGCVAMVSTLRPCVCNELFELYEHDPEIELSIEQRKEQVLQWGPCEHTEGRELRAES